MVAIAVSSPGLLAITTQADPDKPGPGEVLLRVQRAGICGSDVHILHGSNPVTGRKDSAEGTLSVFDALRSFLIRFMIAAKQNETNKVLLDDIVTNNKSNLISTRYVF